MTGPRKGEPAPAFRLPDEAGRERTLEEFRGQPLVLYFYPADFTPGCTREACGFRDAHAEFETVGARIVGVSKDPPKKHEAFRRRHGLGFTLLSDQDGRVHEAYGAGGLVLNRRVTYVLDAEGRVVERIVSLLPGPHVRRALAALQGKA